MRGGARPTRRMRRETSETREPAGRAILLDRDGTLVYPRHYPSRPEELVLYPGVGAQLRALRQAGFRLIVVTNQSGIARGLFSEADLDAMHAHLADELGREGVELDAVYFCPHHPEGRIPELSVRCDCRKPAPGMLLRAARELEIDLARSWMVGDILGDVAAGNQAGCRTVLVDLGTEAPPERPEAQPTYIARDTPHALRIIAAVERLGAEAELGYYPSRWREPASSVSRKGRSQSVATGREAGRSRRVALASPVPPAVALADAI